MRPVNAYSVQTERLVIRCYQPSDAAAMLESIAASKDHLLPWMPWAEHEPVPLDEKIRYLREARGNFDLGKEARMGIFSKNDGTFLGSTGFHDRVKGNGIEIGYWIDVRQAGKGYIREAVAALAKVAFLIEGYDRVEIHCDPRNLGSAKVPERLGFVHEATLKQRWPGLHGPVDEMIWCLFSDTFGQLPWNGMYLKAFDVVGREIAIS